MSDIVERMENYIGGEHDAYVPEVLRLACDEIRRLRIELAEWKHAAGALREGISRFKVDNDALRAKLAAKP